ncbi:DNA mismatch repair endonuclease MutL [Flavobacteriaceae bacterium 14752]|uniref:DNA mismatch repair endonuclease MutL n=1 Tax=Mesohalobacter salilacus TaxID=2491711 RepID=UPI000F635CA2|nr:DNA mismatch repair endonuclease MutL [Flavobacteriaceae bacterium 14752]
MNDSIKLLPDHVANQIAAGEVVQRPASVVKELLENAIDAESTSMTLIVKDSGKTLIQVIDDGKGMTTTDARMAFERHATSKISSAEDLFDLHTKGFRGEALASIAAVSHVELKTKRAEEETGTKILIEGSEVKAQNPCVSPSGTSIGVKNLFYNIPARRNFLKSDQVEQRHIIDEFQRVALAHPDVAFKLIHNGNELFQLPKNNARQRIVGIMGKKINENLVPLQEETDLIKISGFVTKPSYAKRSRGEQFFFVNNRFIKNSYLHHAIIQAFEGLLKPKTHPSYFIYLDIDPKSIDINIHPTKTEIKFEDEYGIYAILRSAVKHSLGQFNVSPVLDFDRDKSLDTDYRTEKSNAKLPKVEVDRNFNPFQDQPKSRKATSQFQHQNQYSTWETLYSGLTEDIENSEDFQFESKIQPDQLFDDTEHQQHTFQLMRKYIVSSSSSGLILVNQHRAHERILYEQFLSQITQEAGHSQQLMFPLSLELSSDEVDLLESLSESLELTGFMFDFSKSEDGVVNINGIPSMLIESQIYEVIDELIADFKAGIPDSGFDRNNRLSMIMAKNMAIANGKSLKTEEQQDIINALFSCKEPSVSPTNQPVFVHMDENAIDKIFRT